MFLLFTTFMKILAYILLTCRAYEVVLLLVFFSVFLSLSNVNFKVSVVLHLYPVLPSAFLLNSFSLQVKSRFLPHQEIYIDRGGLLLFGCLSHARNQNQTSFVILLLIHRSRYSDCLDGWGSIPVSVKIFLFPTSSRTALGPTQPPIKQWIPGTLSPRGKVARAWSWPLPSSSEIKNDGVIIPPFPHVSPWHSA
jgi:hypothetical protein